MKKFILFMFILVMCLSTVGCKDKIPSCSDEFAKKTLVSFVKNELGEGLWQEGLKKHYTGTSAPMTWKDASTDTQIPFKDEIKLLITQTKVNLDNTNVELTMIRIEETKIDARAVICACNVNITFNDSSWDLDDSIFYKVQYSDTEDTLVTIRQ